MPPDSNEAAVEAPGGIGVVGRRRHYQDWATAIWWKVSLVMAAAALVGCIFSLAWLAGLAAVTLVAWKGNRSGVWVEDDSMRVVHPVWGNRRVPIATVDRFVIKPFNQWMAAFLITTSGEEILCAGITSGRKRTGRVDTVVAALNDEVVAWHAGQHAT
jgi:hypothetical protein